MTNVFNKIIYDQSKPESTLGNPLNDPVRIARRQNFFSVLTGGKGFRTPKKSPVVDSQGRTRGDHKRLAWLRAFKPDEYEKLITA